MIDSTRTNAEDAAPIMTTLCDQYGNRMASQKGQEISIFYTRMYSVWMMYLIFDCLDLYV